VRAARIADNKVAEMGAWDMPVLIDDVKLAMDLEGFDLEALGFNVSFVNQHLRLAGELQEPDMPTVPKKPVAKPGQVWQLGEHRIVCGSCADLKNIEQATLRKKARLMVTDPPYGVAYDGGPGAKKKREAILNDALDDMRSFWTECFKAVHPAMQPGACFYVTGPSGELMVELLLAMKDAGFPYRHTLVWVKQSLVMGRSDYQYQHEPIFYGWVDGAPHKPVDDRSETTVWQIDKPSKSELHPTMKPLELYARAMRNSSDEGDLVLEPFSGSGTAIMAAEQLGRRVAAVELSPGYVDVAIMRWEELTGGKATRD
jgi:site-specific DNA-methyltransferase (adenine-specific)